MNINLNKKQHLDAIEILNESASLVESFGKYKFENGKNLIELLTIDDISFWDLFTSELAQTHLPLVLASDKNTSRKIDNFSFYYSILKAFVKYKIKKFQFPKKSFSNIKGDTILCLGFTNQSYRDIMTSIVGNLAHNSSYNVIVISDSKLPSITATITQNSSFIINWQFLDDNNEKIIIEIKKKLKNILQYLELNNFLDRLIPENKYHLKYEFKKSFKRLFYIHLNNIVVQAVIAKSILKQLKPKIIITPDSSDPRARLFTTQASFLNIPSLSVQFGLVGNEAVEWRFLSTNLVSVWGESSRKAILNQKITNERIVITGSPRYDYIYNKEKESNLNKTNLGIQNQKSIVLLASSYGDKSLKNLSLPNTLDIMKSDIFNTINQFPDCVLLIKPHPSENIEQTRKLINNFDNIKIVDKTIDIRELIDICDIFISFGSTATIDALVANKISICPVYHGWSFSDIFKNSGATLNPTNKEELYDLFYKILNKKLDDIFLKKLENSKNKFLENQIFKNDSKSTERIVSLVLSMIKHNELLNSSH